MNEHKFEIISALDKIRWDENCEHLIDINYAHRDMEPAEKILTHWLCYITDRQMPYKRIWNLGGFVFSDLVKAYRKQKAIDLLDPSKEKGFFRTEQGFISTKDADSNPTILKFYPKFLKENKCIFKSRFYSVDFFSIYFTLSILEKYNKSIITYMYTIINAVYNSKNNKPQTSDYIDALVKGLDLLSLDGLSTYEQYDDQEKKYKKKIINSKEIQNLFKIANNSKAKTNKRYITIEARISEISTWLDKGCNEQLDSDERYSSSKRLWCSIRDYIKSPNFSGIFSDALKKEFGDKNDVFKDFQSKVLDDHNGCKYIELPGDVWNENTTFRRCFSENKEELNGKFGKVLRNKWGTKETWYPEQFDITFSIAPRMCEQNNCKYCILSDDNERFDNLKKMCTDKNGKYCPLVLHHCGYRYECPGKEKCTLFNYLEADK